MGRANWSFSEDVATRFIGYGWNVTRVATRTDLEMLGGLSKLSRDDGSSDADYCGQPHRLTGRRTNRIRMLRTESRWREESAAGQEILRLPEDAKFLCLRRGEHFQRDWKRGANAAPVGEDVRGVFEKYPNC